MFNWFKSKVELKNESVIMSSVDNKKGIKIGSELTVPDGFCCLIYSKNKYYTCWSSGKYKLNAESIPTLIAHQQKTTRKVKTIKFVGHYVNLGDLRLKIKYKKQLFVINFSIIDAHKFADLLLLYSYKVDNDYTKEYLSQIFHELLLHNNGNHTTIASNSLAAYGLNIASILPEGSKVSIFSKPTTSDGDKQNNAIEPKPIETNNDSAVLTQNQPSKSTNSSYSCPNCGHITRFSTTYCPKCGYKHE